MSTDARLPELFEQAAELPLSRREAWLADLRSREPALADDIAALLAAGDRRETVLDAPLAKLAMPALSESAPLEETPPPERIGPYRLVREIGRGGMGRVFLAEEEGEHFRRRVALKVLDADPGPVGSSGSRGPAVRRFRDEVRILASLEHPGIARFLDGGRTADGTWFLALEYVEGVGLLEHARLHGLGVADRLRLFLAVLDAVAYAHEQLVVHRDLKPSNVLVGADGRPRLLDFGISKLLEPDDGDAGDPSVTRTELRALTPAYASPEQFRGESATPASDVYSLGVVLYELLTGVRPYRTRSGSRAELERAVLEEDPDPPSTAARRAASDRSNDPTPPTAPPPRLGADLDAICLRALRKEPLERYRTVADFAADVRRYLDGLPVEARRGGARYRAARFVARRRAALGAGAAVALALAALAYAFGTHRAREAAASALATASPLAAATATTTPAPAPKPFPFSSANAPPLEELERRFYAAPADVGAGAALGLALVRAGRTDEASLVVTRLRQIPGRADDPLIDYLEGTIASRRQEPQRALVLQTRALERALAGGRGELVGQIRATRGALLGRLGQDDAAAAELALARADFERAGDAASLARALNDSAIVELQRGRLGEGEKLLEAALATSRASAPTSPEAASQLNNLGGIARLRGRPDLAERRYRESIELLRRNGVARRIPYALAKLSQALRDQGKTAEADATLSEAFAAAREAGDRRTLGEALLYRGEGDLLAGRVDGVPALADELASMAQETGDRSWLEYATTLRGRLAAARGDAAAARRQLAEASRLAQANGDNENAVESLLHLAEVERAEGNAAEATRLIEQARTLQGGERYDGAAEALAQLLLARIAADAGRLDETRERVTAVKARAEGSTSVELRLAFLTARAALARAEGRADDGRRDLDAAIELARSADRKLDELALRRLRDELGRHEPEA